MHTPTNYLAFEQKGSGNGEDRQEKGARGGKGVKRVRDRKGDWTEMEREVTKRGEKWEICPGF